MREDEKAISMLHCMGLSAGLLAGCGAKSVSGSEEATAENPMVLTLSHGLSETHTVHIAMEEFAEKVEERTDGRIKVEIFPNAQLGSETESMEQLTAGVIAMTKVASPILATYEEGYNTFGLPYIFDDTEDFYHVMDSDEMHDFFLSTEDEGFVTLTYYTSGARSFYTKDKAIRTPEDLKGLKSVYRIWSPRQICWMLWGERRLQCLMVMCIPLFRRGSLMEQRTMRRR